MTAVGTPQPQPQPQLSQVLVSTVLETESDNHNNTSSNQNSHNRQYVSPMPRSNQILVNHHHQPTTTTTAAATPIDEAVKLEGAEFEQIMKERARLRREKEDSHVAELRVKVTRLEQALAAETKRRVEATKQLEHHAKEELQHWEDRCRRELEEQRQSVEERLELLETKFGELEERWKRESTQQQKQVAKKGEEFTLALEELRKEAETERKLRQVREDQFLQQIEAHRKDYEGLWDRERQERIECVGELVHQLESNEDARKLGRKAVEVRLEEELAHLQKELEQETMERRKGDDDIHAELERYTLQFQRSLDILHDDPY